MREDFAGLPHHKGRGFGKNFKIGAVCEQLKGFVVGMVVDICCMVVVARG
jgi:hypothetical protein